MSSSSRERERRLRRQSISLWNREWSCIWLPRRRVDRTRRRVQSLSSVRVHVNTRSWALVQQGTSDWWMTMRSGSFAFAGEPAVDHPVPFRWHASSKKNRPSWCLFPFRIATVLPLRTAWIADILSQASPRNVQRQRCWKRGSGDGQRRWDYDTTERSFNAVSALFDAHLNNLQGHRQPIARSDKFVRCAYSRRAFDCANDFSHRARCTKTTLLETW